MMFVVFDLDGTLALIGHRLHHIRDGSKDWDAFFAACPDDIANVPVIFTLKAHVAAGNRVEIWSGRSDVVRRESEEWLELEGIDPALLTRMRPAGDHRPDVDLKRGWLLALHPDDRPDAIYDDRARVVAMWREEGVPCFQVAPGDFDEPDHRVVPPVTRPLLTIMVGPTGSGKTRWARANVPRHSIVSSDELRGIYTGSDLDQNRNDDVFLALHRIAWARLSSGLPTTIDATNLRRKDRLACAAIAPPGAGVRYVVVNRPMADKVRDGGWRNEVRHAKSGLPLIELHEQRFQAQLADILAGDGLPDVEVLDTRERTEAAS